MEKLTVKIILTVLALALTGCSSSENEIDKVPDKSAQSLFVDARSALDNGLYQKAFKYLVRLIHASLLVLFRIKYSSI